MKWTLIFILTFGLLSCNNSTDKKSVNDKIVKNSLVKVDSFHIAENKEIFNCNFDKFLNDPKTPKLAKDLINNTAKYSEESLSYFISLKSKDKQIREFYFKAITNSYKIADGAYSEGLGYSGFEYVKNDTKIFASYFDNVECFTESDLNTWAGIVMLELMIDGTDENNKPIIDDYITKLKSNCKSCTEKQKETINKFGLILKEKWNNYLKNIN
ncbi:hypothetical protein [Flavobacterium sp. DSP2-3-1]|uniref:hypothetical protein n=1 Tax=Flavobacterium sp. DSP2-3-1 TaxID=2804620 RepID=UPI003CFA1A09